MIICWKSTYKIGDIEIDEQHQALFDKANAFMASIDKPMLDACATAFYEYTCTHFSHEETLMVDIRYPGFDRHIQQHHKLLASLNEILEDVAESNLSKSRLESFLNDTFLAHIRAFDTQLAAFVRVQ